MSMDKRVRHWAILTAIGLVLALALAIPERVRILKETEAYRDLMGLSALQERWATSVLIDGKTVTVQGVVKKRRCTFLQGNYYTRSSNGVLVPVMRRESLVADREQSKVRPPSSDPQMFGPWKLTSLIKDPTDLVIIFTMRCPEGDFPQTLIDVPWRDMLGPAN
jgi:hypothetical protein